MMYNLKLFKKLISSILFLFPNLLLFGQGENVILSSPLTQNTSVLGAQTVLLNPGFSTVSYSIEIEVEGNFAIINDEEQISLDPVRQNIQTSLSDMNYIYTATPRQPLQSIPDKEELHFNDLFNEEVTYFDGLGRPLQTNQIAMNSVGEDVIQPFKYDEFGRQKYQYLSYSYTGIVGQYHQYAIEDIPDSGMNELELAYQIYFGYCNDYHYPYSQTVFDDSPLNRIIEQGAQGVAWQPEFSDPISGHTVKHVYSTNNSGDAVRIWIMSGESCSSDFCYNDDQLYVTVNEDENGNIIKEYKNKLDQIILKENLLGSTKLRTYYIYDDFGLLRYVIPPQAVQSYTPSGCTYCTFDRTYSFVKDYCYYYKYDSRKRMVEKQLPGAGTVSMVYDIRDRLVATQNQKQNQLSEWMFIRYDILNRQIMTGIINYSNSRTELQELANIYDTDNELYEVPSASGFHYYSNRSFPNLFVTTESQFYSITYYDNYDFITDLPGSTNFNYIQPDSRFEQYKFERVADLATGEKTKILGTSNNWLSSAIYYNKYGQIIQEISDNHLGGSDRISNNFNNITGELLITHLQHDNDASGEMEKTEEYEYDHAGRLRKAYQKIDSGESILLSALRYNKLGQLESKYLYSDDPYESAKQKIDYKYNIRGWLTEINDPTFLNKDIFGMTLSYNDTSNVPSALNPTEQYNGNISAGKWNVKTHNGIKGLKAYSYDYNDLNMLINANFGDQSNWSTSAYDVTNIDYDLNGNIKTLNRYDNEGYPMDLLEYSYTGLGNKLKRVTDNGNPDKGFIYSSSASDYEYDANGNLKSDPFKEISSISYNYLNLPDVITYSSGATIDLTYDALGNKLQKIVTDSIVTMTDYIGKLVYEDGNLDYITMDEGRIAVPSSGEYVYEYHLKDHLGNTRVAFEVLEDGLSIRQVSDYYPFGMRHTPVEPEHNNDYLYNGKELQRELGLEWYDYGWRYYDPQLGRWHVPDPASEISRRWSPYSYCYDNPIRFIDPDGMVIDDYSIDEKGYIKFEKKTEDPFDMLYIKSDYDKRNLNSGLKVNDKSILPDLAKLRSDFDGSYAISNSKKEMFNVFSFVADNTNVEWGIDGYRTTGKNEYIIRTSHAQDYVTMSTTLSRYNEFNQIFNIHTHPAADGMKGASGYGDYYSGDMANITRTYNKFLNAGMKDINTWFKKDDKYTVFPKHYVYHKHSKVLYYYTPWKNDIYIRHILKASDMYRNLGF